MSSLFLLLCVFLLHECFVFVGVTIFSNKWYQSFGCGDCGKIDKDVWVEVWYWAVWWEDELQHLEKLRERYFGTTRTPQSIAKEEACEHDSRWMGRNGSESGKYYSLEFHSLIKYCVLNEKSPSVCGQVREDLYAKFLNK